MVQKALVAVIAINLVVVLAQFWGGVITASVALLSDALHNASDVVGLLVAWVAAWLALRPANVARTFGYRRAEALATYTNGLLLAAATLRVAYETGERLLFPQPIQHHHLVVVFAAVGLAGNGLSALLLRAEAKKSANIRAAYWHLLADSATSLAVLCSGAILRYYPEAYWVDALFALVIIAALLHATCELLKTSIATLLQWTPKGVDLEAIAFELKTQHALLLYDMRYCELRGESHLCGRIGFVNPSAIRTGEELLQLCKRAEEVAKAHGIDSATLQVDADDQALEQPLVRP